MNKTSRSLLSLLNGPSQRVYSLGLDLDGLSYIPTKNE